ATSQGSASGQNEEHDGMDEMIEDSFFPDGSGIVLRQNSLEGMSAEGAEGDRQQAQQRSNPKSDRIGHFSFLDCFSSDAAGTCLAALDTSSAVTMMVVTFSGWPVNMPKPPPPPFPLRARMTKMPRGFPSRVKAGAPSVVVVMAESGI